MKRPDRQFVGNRPNSSGFMHLQSGYWDNTILCDRHEAALGPLDAYGTAFCRAFMDLLENGATTAVVPNPQPRQLVSFACACLWRMAASRTKHHPERALGPYAKKLSESLFIGGSFEPMLLLSRHAFGATRRELLNFGALPHLYHEEGIRFWRFIVCGLIFDLKLDNRASPPAMATLAVNAQHEITLHEDFLQDPRRTPGLSSSLARLSLSKSTKRSSTT